MRLFLPLRGARKFVHGKLLREWSLIGILLRRAPFIRGFYIRLIDPDRYRTFRVAKWVREGIQWRRDLKSAGISFEADHVWIQLPNGVQLAYLTDICDGGLTIESFAGEYAPDLDRLMLANIEDGATIMDVGANIGWCSIHVCKARKNARVYAFEPGPLAYKYLSLNIAKNRLDGHVTPVNKALADTNGTMFFSNDTVGHGMNHLLPSESRFNTSISVETVRLDDFVAREGIPRVDFIKCDAEGAELLILKGARQTLMKFHPTLLLEVNDFWLERFGSSSKQIVEFLHSLGYSHEVIQSKNEENWLFKKMEKT